MRVAPAPLVRPMQTVPPLAAMNLMVRHAPRELCVLVASVRRIAVCLPTALANLGKFVGSSACHSPTLVKGSAVPTKKPVLKDNA